MRGRVGVDPAARRHTRIRRVREFPLSKRIAGANEPCPCGSGRKYKRCCQEAAASSNTSAPTASEPVAGLPGGSFRFEPGSYGGRGTFAASISCLKQVRPDEWAYHFVLANAAFVYEDEQEAVATAHKHLDEAAAVKARIGSDAAFAAHLSGLGYLKVEGFRVIEERDEGR